MEHKIILKCRICLDDFDEAKMFDLFKEKRSNLKLSEKVEFCCGVRIRESNEMPSKICIKCFDMTRIWYNFRQLCINSQVYLESLCRDRQRPKDADDSEYLEYLFEDLQSFRNETRKENSEFDLKLETAISENDDDNGDETNDEFYETEPILTADSDAELEAMIQNIKKEQEEQAEEHEKENSNQAVAKRQNLKSKKRISAKKSLSSRCLSKRRGRPPSPNSYMCSICGNVYNKKASFTYHMNLHSDVKPHECELCGKKFRQTCELKNHMRRHTGERPYKCSFCDRSFIDRSEKHRHERVHTNTRPYICNVCGKSFMYSAILKNHKKLHSGEKDFNCLVCQKAFTLQHQLKAHLQTTTHKQKEAQFVGAGFEVVYE